VPSADAAHGDRRHLGRGVNLPAGQLVEDPVVTHPTELLDTATADATTQ